MTDSGEPPLLLRRLVGDALRRNRTRQGRTLRDVAEAARVSMPYLSEVERGRKEASSEVLAAVCRGLGLRLSELLEEVRRDLLALEPRREPAPTPAAVRAARELAAAGAPARSAQALPATTALPTAAPAAAAPAAEEPVPVGAAAGPSARTADRQACGHEPAARVAEPRATVCSLPAGSGLAWARRQLVPLGFAPGQAAPAPAPALPGPRPAAADGADEWPAGQLEVWFGLVDGHDRVAADGQRPAEAAGRRLAPVIPLPQHRPGTTGTTGRPRPPVPGRWYAVA
ncbi:MAG: helix-turn-helix transcriptional regulator [Frankia sp.]|nr:helix-turn-helix transcriptional regulator [Frankia sp.]